MVGFIVICILCFFAFFIATVALFQDEKEISFWIFLIAVFVLFLTLNVKSVRYLEQVEIPHSELSILIDDEVAIIRYDNNMETYKQVKYYKAILNGNFKFKIIKEENIFGQDNGYTHNIELVKNNQLNK